ncbi:hypothetical protein [Fictibacillus barbaricus]|nr:hypothetical protein [Fictibacillus barbaricus]
MKKQIIKEETPYLEGTTNTLIIEITILNNVFVQQSGTFLHEG